MMIHSIVAESSEWILQESRRSKVNNTRSIYYVVKYRNTSSIVPWKIALPGFVLLALPRPNMISIGRGISWPIVVDSIALVLLRFSLDVLLECFLKLDCASMVARITLSPFFPLVIFRVYHSNRLNFFVHLLRTRSYFVAASLKYQTTEYIKRAFVCAKFPVLPARDGPPGASCLPTGTRTSHQSSAICTCTRVQSDSTPTCTTGCTVMTLRYVKRMDEENNRYYACTFYCYPSWCTDNCALTFDQKRNYIPCRSLLMILLRIDALIL